MDYGHYIFPVQVEGGYTEEERLKIYKEAVKKWGVELQMSVMVEEMAELTKAIMKDKRKPCVVSAEKILEEAVDVLLMLEQLFLILATPKCGFMQTPTDIQNMVKYKLKRTERRIKEE